MTRIDDAVAAVLHPADVDSERHPDVPTALYDWAGHLQPRSRNAKALAEPYLHRWLAAAADAGHAAGKADARRAVLAIAVAAAVLTLLLLAVGG